MPTLLTVHEGTNSNIAISNIFVVMKNAFTTDNLFSQFPNTHDKGGFTVGSIIISINPKPIKNFINSMPMFELQNEAILVHPVALPSVHYCNDLDANEMK
eukprot:472971-Ditylum_brightwellii.AAC.1